MKKAKAKTAAKKTKSAEKKSGAQDIVQLILADHKPLKQLIKVLKSEDAEFDEKKEAFEEFAPLLVSHAIPEEESLYVFMKKDDEMRTEGFEGDVEHGIADQLLEEIKRTEDQDEWMAKVKVLGELVEHHIEEEEEDMLPDFKKNSELADRQRLAKTYILLQQKLLEQGGQDTVEEKSSKLIEESSAKVQ